MVFNSYTFIVFFVLVLLIHNLPLAWRIKKVNLLLASYAFYAAWNPPFILLLWFSTLIDFQVGRALYRQENKFRKKALLIISLMGNLGMLCFFKYGGFLLENFVYLVNAIGVNFHPAEPNIILPAGISFYTFTTLCYTIDMYHRKSEPVRSLLDFSLFVTFFPHLVAGPIVRPPQLVPQFETPRTATLTQLMQGLFLLSLGLWMKVVMADTLLATAADMVFNTTKPLPGLDVWLGVLAFSGQIFFDFAGYSTCAIGAALCLGFVLPENFRFPYAAIGFSDFWQRWHITLSSWLRDYVYIPLGGNRNGETRTYVNLMITMLLGGLWHGAGWTFVAWGALHGIYLCAERFIREKLSPSSGFTREGNRELVIEQASMAPAFLRNRAVTDIVMAMFTFFLVNVSWVFFRASSFASAWRMLTSMFGQSQQAVPILPTIEMIKVAVVIPLMLAVHWFMRNRSVLELAQQVSWPRLAIGWSVLLIALVICQKSGDTFIYFQF